MLQVELQFRRDQWQIDARFAAPTPGITALFGRSGAGKTTLVQLIAGLLKAQGGSLRLDGTTLFDARLGVDVPAEARRMGCMFQDLRLFPHLHVEANLRYGLQRAHRHAIRIPFDRAVELLDLGHLLRRRSWQLSGGERQRVALGRALLSQPQLLLLDEPLTAIDGARRFELLPWFERLRDELALPMVLVTHQFEDVVRLASYVVLIESGRVLAAGDLQAVSLRPDLGTMLGSEGIGAVIEGRVEAIDATTGLATIRVGTGQLLLPGESLIVGRTLRLQVLARDLILATESPRGLSVRNQLRGHVTGLTNDPPHNVVVALDAGGVALLARVTEAAAQELQVHAGQPLWVLVKAVSLRGHA